MHFLNISHSSRYPSFPAIRNIFLSAGSDGYVKLFHMFETMPLRQWAPEPSPDTPGKFLFHPILSLTLPCCAPPCPPRNALPCPAMFTLTCYFALRISSPALRHSVSCFISVIAHMIGIAALHRLLFDL